MLAARLNLSTAGSRTELIDRIIDFCDRNGWPDQADMDQIACETMSGSSDIDNRDTGSVKERANAGEASEDSPPLTNLQIMDRVQEMSRALQAVTDTLRELSQRQDAGRSAEMPLLQRGGSNSGSSGGANGDNKWQQIKFAAKLIPFFFGKEKENILKWLERIRSVGRIHGFGEEVLVLAAVTQLKGRALE